MSIPKAAISAFFCFAAYCAATSVPDPGGRVISWAICIFCFTLFVNYVIPRRSPRPAPPKPHNPNEPVIQNTQFTPVLYTGVEVPVSVSFHYFADTLTEELQARIAHAAAAALTSEFSSANDVPTYATLDGRIRQYVWESIEKDPANVHDLQVHITKIEIPPYKKGKAAGGVVIGE